MVSKHYGTSGFEKAPGCTILLLAVLRERQTNVRRDVLRSLFFAFPCGWPGAALLLLRIVFGVALLVEGSFYVDGPNPSAAAWAMALPIFIAGGLLVIGCATPIVATVVGAGLACVRLSLLPAGVPTLFDSRVSVLFGFTMLATIAALGPGAFSVDARTYGRREIIIPPRASQQQTLTRP